VAAKSSARRSEPRKSSARRSEPRTLGNDHDAAGGHAAAATGHDAAGDDHAASTCSGF
jgi:hypothetical protein